MINPKFLSDIVPNARYQNGFLMDEEVLPFYSFCGPNVKGNWSNEMAESLEESSRDHFIDIYNRKIAIDALREHLSDNSTYIDIGCSSGYMLEDVMAKFPSTKIFGADYFASGLNQCHKRLPDVPLFQLDIVNCKMKSDIFDAITCLNVLEHIEDDSEALKQMNRILKPTGVIIATVPLAPNLYDLYDEIHYHLRRYRFNEFQKKFINAGFRILKSNYFGVSIYPAFYITKKYNQYKYRDLSFEKKQELAFKQIHSTERMRFMDCLCDIERRLGKKIKYPFGVRGYVVAVK
jgi:ubiquinone/menaquinone biosynthesis C-methylase UbiE